MHEIFNKSSKDHSAHSAKQHTLQVFQYAQLGSTLLQVNDFYQLCLEALNQQRDLYKQLLNNSSLFA